MVLLAPPPGPWRKEPDTSNLNLRSSCYNYKLFFLTQYSMCELIDESEALFRAKNTSREVSSPVEKNLAEKQSSLWIKVYLGLEYTWKQSLPDGQNCHYFALSVILWVLKIFRRSIVKAGIYIYLVVFDLWTMLESVCVFFFWYWLDFCA